MSDKDEVAPAAIYGHCLTTYQAMLSTAQIVEGDAGEEMVVWEGMLTHLISDLHLSTPYYTKIRRDLLRMGCVAQLKRGGGTAPSQWRLIKEPTIDLFNEAQEPKAPPIDKYEILKQDFLQIVRRVQVLEEALENVIRNAERG